MARYIARKCPKCLVYFGLVINQLPGSKLPVKALFESPTIAEMALIIEKSQARMTAMGDTEHIVEDLEAISEKEAKRELEKGLSGGQHE